MLWSFAKRLFRETDRKVWASFAWNFGLKGMWSIWRFRRRRRRGQHFPPVLFLSITTACNLRCQGCWVSVTGPRRDMPPEQLDRIIADAKRRGNFFFGILGGEPLLYDGLWDILGRHGDCYFQVFTNGTLLTEEVARRMRRLANVTPLVSIEGLEAVSDERRGGRDVYAAAMDALEHCRRNRLLTGVATSLCQSNIDELLTESFLAELIRRGVHYLWYYVYRPTGPLPSPELALTAEQVRRVRRFTVDVRPRTPMLVIDAFWDDQGRALCPAASGISHHVNPWGDIEPCPPIQFSAENVADGADVCSLIDSSRFFEDFRELAAKTTRGCLLLERPDLLRQLVLDHAARDSTGRGTGLAELAAMIPRCSHNMDGDAIPERHWLYRLAKRHWFFSFGAYA